MAKLAKLTPTLSVFGKAKGGTVCYYCGKPGHWKKDCLELKAIKIQAAARGYLSRLRVHQMKAKRSTLPVFMIGGIVVRPAPEMKLMTPAGKTSA